MHSFLPTSFEIYAPARAREIQRHIGSTGCDFVPTVLHNSVPSCLQHFVRRGCHESVPSRALVFHPDEYFHNELLSTLGFPPANAVDILEILSTGAITVSPVIPDGRPQGAPFFLVLQSD